MFFCYNEKIFGIDISNLVEDAYFYIRILSEKEGMKGIRRLHILATLTVLLCIVFTNDVEGQNLWQKLKESDSLMTSRYRNSNIDTTYIRRPNTKWTVKGRLNISGARLLMEGVQRDIAFKSRMKADYKSTLSMGVSYLGVTLSFALNPAKLLGKYNDFEFNLNSYSNRWGFDIIYQNAHNFTGWHKTKGQPRIDLPAEVLSLRSLNLNGYYAFNYRRFSYPAAFSQTYIQRRSSGSFLLGLSLQGQQAESKEFYESKLNSTNIGIGAGYGYNWVPNRRWLIHVSTLPTLIVYSKTLLRVSEDRVPFDYHFPEIIVIVRGAIIRQIHNMFAGLTMVYNFTSIGGRDQLLVDNGKWRARLIFGYRF